MKIHPECMPCLFERAKLECDLAFGGDEKGKLKALMEVARFASEEIREDTVPALIGTMRGRIISQASGVKDPYARLKKESNKAGEEVLSWAKSYYENAGDKPLALMKIAAAANSMEYGVRGHSFDEERFKHEFSDILNEEVKGDIAAAKRLLKKYRKVLYILDNAGEAVLDRFVIEELKAMGKEVIASPKSAPVINDVTADELLELGFDPHGIVPSGAFVGVSLVEAPKDFLRILFDPGYLVVAKGMGNYETLSEFEHRLKERLIYILRAKCHSVAESLGVKKGALVVTTI